MITIKKVLNLPGLRLNLSKSGIGTSAGVKGARLGLGTKGAYVSLAKRGVYYRATIAHPGESTYCAHCSLSRPAILAITFLELGIGLAIGVIIASVLYFGAMAVGR